MTRFFHPFQCPLFQAVHEITTTATGYLIPLMIRPQLTITSTILAGLLLFITSAVAEDDRVRKSFEAVRTDTPPTIDGKIDDKSWEDAAVLTDFIDTRSETIAVQQTFVRVLYDDEFLYIAFDCRAEPGTTLATERKYDRFRIRFEDYVQVGIDTFVDRSRAYIFLVNPLGTRWDARDGVFGRNDAWDADWPAGARMTETGWTAEMAIPIGVMDLNSGPDKTWGINFRRQSYQVNIASHWNYNAGKGVPRRVQGPKFIADFGNITGLDLSNLKVDRDPDLETQFTASFDQRQKGSVHSEYGAGFDLSLRLTSNWTATATLNPNFSEVEDDTGDVQNRDTQRFLFERRTFFNEGAELFRTPLNLYDSRNIADINFAVKLTGTGTDWTAAALALDGHGVRSGPAKYFVGRYLHSLTDKLKLGALITLTDRANGKNWVVGIDARYDITPTITFTTQYLQMGDKKNILVEDRDGRFREVTNRESEHGFVAMVYGGTKPWSWFVDFKDISGDFLPDLSFIERFDIQGSTASVSYSLDKEEGIVERYNWKVFVEYYKNHKDITALRDFFVEGGVDFNNNWDFRLSHQEDFHLPFDNRTSKVQLYFNRQNRWRSVEVALSWGTFETVDFEQLDLQWPFKIGDKFTTEVTSTFRRESPPMHQPDNDVWIWRTVSEYTFDWDGRIKLILEASSDNSYLRTLLFAYEDVARWDFFLELNDARAPNRERVQRSIFTKFVYHW